MIVVTAEQATLALHLSSGGLFVAGPKAEIEGVADVTFRAAVGSIQHQAQRVHISNEPLVVSGRLSLQTWNATSDGRLQATVQASDATIRFPTREEFEFASTAPSPTKSGPSWLTWAGIALVGIVLVVFFFARRHVTIDDVEWELLNGNLQRSQRLATRLVRRTPHDPDAIFLLGAALLTQARHAELVRRLEPLAEDLKPSQRRGVAYVLAVAAHVVGDDARAERWANEAAAEPLLLARMRKDGLLRRPIPGSVEPVGYA